MKRTIIIFVLLVGGLWATGPCEAGFYPAHGSQDHVYFWRQDSQEHFWLSAAGTFLGSQIFQYYGMGRTSASILSAAEILGLGMGKAYLIDPKPGKNAITCDILGVLLGSVLNVTVHFDFYGSKSAVQVVPDRS